jgi:pyruvate/2-oxoglutarate dehydrogenase complex dihydrolipoamide acyltransferase (E2) component
MVVAVPFLIAAVSFLVALLSIKGSGYLVYESLELPVPENGRVQRLLVEDGRWVQAGAPLLAVQVGATGELPRRGNGVMTTRERIIAAPVAGVVESIRVAAGSEVVSGAPALSLRTGHKPRVRAWMRSDELGRLWPGRPAVVRLPDGSRLPAVISQVMASTEKLPEELATSSFPVCRCLVVTLELGAALQPAQRVNYLPVEVFLRWRDELLRSGPQGPV